MSELIRTYDLLDRIYHSKHSRAHLYKQMVWTQNVAGECCDFVTVASLLLAVLSTLT